MESMFTTGTVTLVTAATGHRVLAKCVQSVQQQTYPRLRHWIVIDGPEHADKVRGVLAGLDTSRKATQVLALPVPTGKLGWCGHRIHGACSYISNSQYITFLDEDNWIDPHHVESLVSAIETAGATWGFALRKIFDAEGNFVTLDECECLGNLHPIFHHDQVHHIDTNCYMMRREVAAECAPKWYVPARSPGMLEADTSICRYLMRNHPGGASNRLHTVNYTVASRADSVKPEFFLHGNAVMRKRYPDGLPWLRG